ncbi:class I SAM-dependent methyltransferase [Sulfurimonas sp.]|uniref:class I SAM-dependent methyltransferase n=1 Tax=Sulfurimonas sp. TaxID=2022749 RepID=UPI0019F7C8BA|nr:class I SAM-dependent methyltransferase [Sulfurimonas sp.]MBE0514910.1 methyltransferase domain-containing protein [Sulfurimonas sp.]
MNKWKDIWNKRELNKLISADGFDTGYGSINEVDWSDYVDYIKNKLAIGVDETIYEVGCGSGAFLYKFYENKNDIGGIDYSDKLIDVAKKYMPNGYFEVNDAQNIETHVKYDYVISNSVFFYFPSYEYAEITLIKMIEKSIKGIAILEVNDLEKKEESIKLRKGYLSDDDYAARYKDLEHLYYKKDWFIDIARKYNLKIEIEQQNINNYANNLYRFNVFMYKA